MPEVTKNVISHSQRESFLIGESRIRKVDRDKQADQIGLRKLNISSVGFCSIIFIFITHSLKFTVCMATLRQCITIPDFFTNVHLSTSVKVTNNKKIYIYHLLYH